MYTLIIMPSRGDSVRQKTISRVHVLFFWLVIFTLFFAAAGGMGYGFFKKQQSATTEKDLLTSTEEIESLVRARHQAEASLAAVSEEMKDIRHMTRQVWQTLEISGQGGGNNDITSTSEEIEGQTDVQQEKISTSLKTEMDVSEITSTVLRQEIQPVYNYVNAHREEFDGYPSILPVELQQPDGKTYGFWYSSLFGLRLHPLTQSSEFHQGLDIKTRVGVPVIAAADGAVEKIEKTDYLGNTVEIVHEASQLKTVYAHLKGYAEGLKVGQKVTRGETIGYVGNTGRSTGAHLHYGVYDLSKEEWVDPIPYIFDQQPTFSP